MLQLLSVTTIFVFFLSPFICTTISDNAYSTNEALSWTEVTATRLISCYYNGSSGLFTNELAWQSGNTIESIANSISLLNLPLKYIFNQTFTKTDAFVGGDCYDDYQWWLLGWVQAYSVDPNITYLQRAAAIHDTVTAKAWNTTQCGGGIQWCPTNSYKNAITNELFLSSSMRLHPYATLLGKSQTYYLDWALKEWLWFEKSGMINSNYLINDGLSSSQQLSARNVNSLIDDTCVNNNQTTWTYNQGVILSGLALLYNATNNSTLIDIAQKIADATIHQLTYANGILKEPCEPDCDNDQKLFKGIFARHLGYLLPYLTDPFHIQNYTSFLQQNAVSLWTSSRCEKDGLYSPFWNNNSSDSCNSSRDTASTTSALDLLISVARPKQQVASSNWMLLGLGNCVDNNNVSMSNFRSDKVNETTCRTAANDDSGAVAYDYELYCNGFGYCRVRTLSDKSHTPPRFDYEAGTARNVTRTNKMMLTNCYLKTNQTSQQH